MEIVPTGTDEEEELPDGGTDLGPGHVLRNAAEETREPEVLGPE